MRRNLRSLLGAATLVALTTSVGSAGAAPGDLDPSFSSDGIVRTSVGQYSGANDVAVQQNGRIVVAGWSGADFAVVRYLPNGKLDRSFSGDGKVRTPSGANSGEFQDVAVQPDGKVVVVGVRSISMGESDFVVARYTARGRLDREFSTDGLVTVTFGNDSEAAEAVALQPDGRIVAVGTSGPDFALVRLRGKGGFDSDFDADGKQTTSFGSFDSAYGVAVQRNGKVVVAGTVNESGDHNFATARYRRNGSLDPGFGLGGKQVTSLSAGNDVGRTLTLQPDGKVVVGGYAGGTNLDFGLIRYDSTGELDSTFGTGGIVRTEIGTSLDDAFALATQAGGRIVAAGQTFDGVTNHIALVRYKRNGDPDLTFSGSGKITTPLGAEQSHGWGVATLSKKRILVVGHGSDSTRSRIALLRYLGTYPEVAVSNARRIEGDGGTRMLRFPVRLSTPPGSTPVDVFYRTAEGTAVAPQDYLSEQGDLRFSGARVLRWIRVVAFGDRRVEPNERFRVRISQSGNATLGRARGTGTIRNDD